MHEDIQLYDATYDKRVECKALNIPEELGQVHMISIWIRLPKKISLGF